MGDGINKGIDGPPYLRSHGDPREEPIEDLSHEAFMDAFATSRQRLSGSGLQALDNVTVMAMHRLLSGTPLADAFGEDGTERFPSEPPDLSVLRFEKTWGKERAYTYVALRVGDTWYLSGKRIKTMGWVELRNFIHNNRCWISTAWAEIPVPEESPVEELTPAEWHRINYGQAIDGSENT